MTKIFFQKRKQIQDKSAKTNTLFENKMSEIDTQFDFSDQNG